MYENIEEIIETAKERNASDIHISVNQTVKLRIDGALVPLCDERPDAALCERYAIQIIGDKYDGMKEIGEVDAGKTLNGRRLRINVYRQRGCVSIAIRLLSNEIPDISKLGVPNEVQQFPSMRRGLVLVTGETGSGKSTTLAAVVSKINHTRNAHIITLEDPVEYIHTADRCQIDQREIGLDTKSYADGLRASLREDPDVILLGEMRDLVTMETALQAAETGHMVFSTLHTKSAADSIDRMIEMFPAEKQKQIRMQLSSCLNAIVSQQLLPGIREGRVLACELMMVTPAIRNLIREEKTHQLQNSISTGANEGSQLMDHAIMDLYRNGKISMLTAITAAHDPETVKQTLTEENRQKQRRQ